MAIDDLHPSGTGQWQDDLHRRALELGASGAAITSPERVATAEWVRLKCLYGGCTVGRCLTCPPHSPTPSETRSILDEYASILVLRFDARPRDGDQYLDISRRATRVALRLERELFLQGDHKAFAIAGGRPCDRHAACGEPATCDCREDVRPGPAGCGIDVFTTSANVGWPLAVVKGPLDPYHRLALVLVR